MPVAKALSVQMHTLQCIGMAMTALKMVPPSSLMPSQNL